MKTFKLHLIRHGYSQANLDGAYCGSTDLPLCAEGEQHLYSMLEDVSYPYVDAVYSSPMLRARQTVGILYPEYEPVLVEDLRECSFGEFEGKTLQELKKNDDFNRWVTPGSDFKPAGVDDPEVFFQRCCDGFLWVVDNMMQSGMHECALVTHAGVIGNILAQFAYPKQAPYDWQCGPGGGFTVRIDPTIYLREPVVEVIGTVPPYDEAQDDGLGGDIYDDYADDALVLDGIEIHEVQEYRYGDCGQHGAHGNEACDGKHDHEQCGCACGQDEDNHGHNCNCGHK